MDGNTVKLGGITVIVGGFFSLVFIPLATLTVALGAGLALIGFGMKSRE